MSSSNRLPNENEWAKSSRFNKAFEKIKDEYSVLSSPIKDDGNIFDGVQFDNSSDSYNCEELKEKLSNKYNITDEVINSFLDIINPNGDDVIESGECKLLQNVLAEIGEDGESITLENIHNLAGNSKGIEKYFNHLENDVIYKSDAQKSAERLINNLFGEINIPDNVSSYQAVGAISKSELNNKLGTNFDTAYASQATITFAKKLHGQNEIVYVDNKNVRHSITSKSDIEKYKQTLPQDSSEIPIGSVVIMNNPDGSNFHSGVVVGFSKNGKALVMEANSDKANGGAAIVLYDFNSKTEKSITGYIPIEGLSDNNPKIDIVIDDKNDSNNKINDSETKDDSKPNNVNSNDDVQNKTKSIFQTKLEKIQEKEDTEKTKNIGGAQYHFDSEGNLLYTQAKGTTITDEQPLSKSADYINAVNQNGQLNLDVYYKEYHNREGYNSQNKGENYAYSLAVGGAIVNTLAQYFNIKVTDENGNYTNEMKSLYKQIVDCNKESFISNGYNFDENTSIYDINKALAKFSWDGNGNNDLVNLSGITKASIENYCRQHESNITNLYEYDKDGQLKSVTKAHFDTSANKYVILGQKTYDYSDTDCVKISEHDYDTEQISETVTDKTIIKTQQKLSKELLEMQDKVANKEVKDGKIYFFDDNNQLLYTASQKKTAVFIRTLQTTSENQSVDSKDKNASSSVSNLSSSVDKTKPEKYEGYNITLYNYDETGKVIGETNGIVSCANINDIALQTPDEYIPTTTKQYEYTFSGTQTTYSQYIQGKEEVYTIKRSKSELEKAKSYAEIMNRSITAQNNANTFYTPNDRYFTYGNQVLEYENGKITHVVQLNKYTTFYDNQGSVQAFFSDEEYSISEEKVFEYHGDNVTVTTFNSDGTLKTMINSDGTVVDNPITIKLIDSDEAISTNSVQNLIGDCYLVSALHAFASVSKGAEIINNAITRNDNGDFLVTLYNRQNQKETFVVPHNEISNLMIGDMLNISTYGKGDVDLTVFEKAYEQLRKREGKDLNGGSFNEIARALTGKNSHNIESDKKSLSWIKNNGNLIGKNIVADLYVFTKNGIASNCVDVNGKEINLFGGLSLILYDKNGNPMEQGHALSIVAYNSQTGVITLRNTHGEGTYNIPLENLKGLDIGVDYLNLI